MDDYSFEELADMHYCYGFADGQSVEAAQIYKEKFPERRHPDHIVFQKIDIQLRETGDFSRDNKDVDVMSDTEVKRKGRPKKRDSEVSEPVSKKAAISNGDETPVKRGRGRPPKGGAASQKKAPVTGRGRGRPPKTPAKKAKKESEDEEEDVDDDEKKESSCEADSS